jgi:LmbE family N-acetylglucosaminyl deacetylase
MANVLVIAPHTDDETVGCGGFIHKLRDNNIRVVALSFCGQGRLINEFNRACKVLAPTGEYLTEHFKVRTFPEQRQKILDCLISHREQFKPDLVLCPASYDVHQDHHQTYLEAVRAFKSVSVLGYAHSWNTLGVGNARFDANLSFDDIEAKSEAMDEYKSQSGRGYFENKDWLANERFEVINYVHGN